MIDKKLISFSLMLSESSQEAQNLLRTQEKLREQKANKLKAPKNYKKKKVNDVAGTFISHKSTINKNILILHY